MPIPNINTSYNNSIKEIGILSNYMTDCASLESKYQYFISEVVMIRLFAILETTIGEIALKLACGAVYKNETAPLTQVVCSSINDANGKMLTHNRGRSNLRWLKWTNENDIEKSIKHVLVLTDKFFVAVQNHASLIDEMRIVRNHIAHRNSGTARQYYQVLHAIYTGNLKIAMGAFLISTTRHTLPNIKRYLISVPVILQDLSNG